MTANNSLNRPAGRVLVHGLATPAAVGYFSC
jgi:hypothetical protein